MTNEELASSCMQITKKIYRWNLIYVEKYLVYEAELTSIIDPPMVLYSPLKHTHKGSQDYFM